MLNNLLNVHFSLLLLSYYTAVGSNVNHTGVGALNYMIHIILTTLSCSLKSLLTSFKALEWPA